MAIVDIQDIEKVAAILRDLIKKQRDKMQMEAASNKLDLEDRIHIGSQLNGLIDVYLLLIQRFPEIHDDSLDGYILSQHLRRT